MVTLIFYTLTILLIIWSTYKDRTKTKQALLKGWHSFEKILPLFLSIFCGIGIILSFLTPQTIAYLLGSESGWHGTVLAAIVGSCTVIPGFVTFPLARTLLQNGAGMLQIIIFISTSVMVGILTLPVEIQYFGKKVAYIRNTLAILFSFIIAFIMEALLQ